MTATAAPTDPVAILETARDMIEARPDLWVQGQLGVGAEHCALGWIVAAALGGDPWEAADDVYEVAADVLEAAAVDYMVTDDVDEEKPMSIWIMEANDGTHRPYAERRLAKHKAEIREEVLSELDWLVTQARSNRARGWTVPVQVAT